MLLSGGYSRESYKLVAGTVVELLRRHAGDPLVTARTSG